MHDDERWMGLALDQARQAPKHDDVPIGAVVVCDGELVSAGHNHREADQDPTAHAEVLAVREAAHELGRWRLDDATVYSTLEPCAMCAGALVLARVERLVIGSDDPKAGAVGTLFDVPRDPRLNHQVSVSRGVLADDCARVLRDFFVDRR